MSNQATKKTVTWGNTNVKKKKSIFFRGINIIQQLANSSFGKIKQTFEAIFQDDDISDYRLPKVIVIGNESTGKSSLLENITKCQFFPRDSKICTKCPIHLKLAPSQASKCSISFNGHPEEMCNKEIIYEKIVEYMKGIPDDNISEDEIVVSLSDTNLPTFEFYDLPGIRAYPPKSCEITTKLCRKYLQDNNTVVLCVVPATTPRLTSCQSIALIQEMNMEANTILALTMTDRLQPENFEELLIKRILQTSDELTGLKLAAIVAVVNRLHTDVVSLHENDNIESKWFDKHIISCVPPNYVDQLDEINDRVTVDNLICNMDNLYDEFIKKDWKPKIITMIDNKILSLEQQLELLGKSSSEIDLEQTVKMMKDHIISYKFNEKKYVFPDCNKLSENFSDVYADFYAMSNYITELSLFFAKDNQRLNDYIDYYSLYFNDKTDLKMERFEYLKDTVILDIRRRYNKAIENEIDIIKNKVLIFIEMSMGHNSYITPLSKISDKFEVLFITYIMQPLKTLMEIKITDFVENETYSTKRKNINIQLNKARLHKAKINEIGNDD